jgi:hypothetical protein
MAAAGLPVHPFAGECDAGDRCRRATARSRSEKMHDQQAHGLDASLDVERVPADTVEGDVPTSSDDESLVGKLLREGADALDAADIEDPEGQL